jgi:hypothetical protein
MARPRRDGFAPREANKRKLTELYVEKCQREQTACCVWDTLGRLVLKVERTGSKAWKCV